MDGLLVDGLFPILGRLTGLFEVEIRGETGDRVGLTELGRWTENIERLPKLCLLIDLLGADLLNADLLGADLLNADLLETDLLGADLLEADLLGADLPFWRLVFAKTGSININKLIITNNINFLFTSFMAKSPKNFHFQ